MRSRWLIAAVVFALVWSLRSPIIVPDSLTYMEAWPTRPPLLPLVYNAWKAVGGGAFAVRATIFVQALVALLSSGLLLRATAALVSLGLVARAFVLGALMLPQLKAASTIASESFAYSFVCIFCAILVGGIRGQVSVWRGLALVSAALAAYATRAQFIYLVPLSILAAAVGCHWLRRRERVLLLGGSVLLAGTVLGATGLYLKHRSGAPGGVSVMGVQLLTSVVHVAVRNDLNAAQLGKHRVFAESLYARLERDGLLASQRDPASGEVASSFFAERYNMILVRMADEFQKTELAHAAPVKQSWLWGLSAEQLRDLDAATISVATSLMRSNWRRYLGLVFGSVWEWHRYFCITVLFVSAFAVAELCRNRFSRAAWLMALSGAAWLTNICVVTLVEPPLYRYSFYFDAIFLATLCAVVADALGASVATRVAVASTGVGPGE